MEIPLSELKTYDDIRKIATDQGDNYITCCLLVYLYFKEQYNLIGIYFSKRQKLDADPKAIQQINFTGKPGKNARIFFRYWRSESKSFNTTVLIISNEEKGRYNENS